MLKKKNHLHDLCLKVILYIEYDGYGQIQRFCGLKEDVAIAIMKQIFSAVDYFYSNSIWHRDINENILKLEQTCHNVDLISLFFI